MESDNEMWKEVNGYEGRYEVSDHDAKEETKLEKDETFKNIGTIDGNDFSGYEISNYGKVRNIRRNTYVAPIKRGYECTQIYEAVTKKPAHFQVHRLVVMRFVGGQTPERNVVNHIDKNKQNNYYKNLEWTTIKGNIEHAVGRRVQ